MACGETIPLRMGRAMTARLPYRPDIDGIRAIAVGLVVVFHFGLVPLGKAGFIGVDIFFVISGFLITRIVTGALERDDFSLGGFYLARIRRLYPALVTVLAGYLVAGWFLFLPDLYAELALEAALSQLYVVNFHFWRSVNYFGLHADGVPLLHMWSLAVEEQFYIFYPLVLVLLHRHARRHLLPILAACMLASFALGWFATGWKPWAAFYLLPTRAWELLAGGILALVLARHRPPPALVRIAGPVGLALIALTLALSGQGFAFPGWFAALPVVAGVALLLSGERPDAAVSRILALAPMVWLGRISYPLYLVHWPVLIVLRNVLPEVSLDWRLTGLALSVALAWAILRLVETPIRSGRLLSRRGALLATAGGLSTVLVACCLIGWQSGGMPDRFDPRVSRILAYAKDRPTHLERCDWPAGPCPIGPEGEPAVAVIGDSHAQAFGGAFDHWLRERGQPGQLNFASGCMPVPRIGVRRCADFAEAAIAQAAASPTIRTVFLASIWRQAYGDGTLIADGRRIEGAAIAPAFEDALITAVRRLRAAGKDVILIDPLYAAPHDVPHTLARNLAFGTDWPVDISLAQHLRDFAPLLASFERVEAEGAKRISFLVDLCSPQICPGTHEGTPLFADGNHIRYGLSALFAGYLDRAVQGLRADHGSSE